MAFLLTVRVPLSAFPDLEATMTALRRSVGATLRVDPETEAAVRSGAPRSSWCPWPRRSVGFYVPGATTRGCEAQLEQQGSSIEVRICQPVLATWTDWRTTVELAAQLAEQADAPVDVDSGTPLPPDELRRRFLSDDGRWEAECVAGGEAVRVAVQKGRVVRLGGPAGFAAVGPRSWSRLGFDDDEEVPVGVLVDFIQRSIEARGFDTYYPANLLCLDGRSGREVIASLLAPDVPTLFRDPEYVLVGDDLENTSGPDLRLLRFEDLDEAIPRRVTWIDDRTCAVPPISAADWPGVLETMRPWLTPINELLDAGDGIERGDTGAWRAFLPEAPDDRGGGVERSPPGSAVAGVSEPTGGSRGSADRPWWKFW